MVDATSSCRWWVVGVLPVLLLACDDPTVGDQLTVTARPNGGSLQVDDRCNPACAGADSVDVQIAYAKGTTPQQGNVQLLQYRVDYTLTGVRGDVPFYAGQTSFDLPPGGNQTQTVRAVGSAQRDFVRQAAGDAVVTGTAKLTLAGYDYDNRQVTIDAVFEVSFGRASGAGAADAGGSDAHE